MRQQDVFGVPFYLRQYVTSDKISYVSLENFTGSPLRNIAVLLKVIFRRSRSYQSKPSFQK